MTDKFIACGLDEDVYAALMRYATFTGKHPSRLLEEWVIAALEAAETDVFLAVPIEVKVFNTLQKQRATSRLRSQLVQIAMEHSESPSEESADRLQELCKEAGVSMEAILKESMDSTLVPLRDDDSSVAKAIAWLVKTLAEGQEYPVSELMELASKDGLSATQLKDAKRQLGIVSARKSHQWIWRREAAQEIQ